MAELNRLAGRAAGEPGGDERPPGPAPRRRGRWTRASSGSPRSARSCGARPSAAERESLLGGAREQAVQARLHRAGGLHEPRRPRPDVAGRGRRHRCRSTASDSERRGRGGGAVRASARARGIGAAAAPLPHRGAPGPAPRPRRRSRRSTARGSSRRTACRSRPRSPTTRPARCRSSPCSRRSPRSTTTAPPTWRSLANHERIHASLEEASLEATSSLAGGARPGMAGRRRRAWRERAGGRRDGLRKEHAMKRAALLWFVAGLLVAGGASAWINARGAGETAAAAGPGGALPLPDAPELRLRQARRLPDLRHEARADGERGRGQALAGPRPGHRHPLAGATPAPRHPQRGDPPRRRLDRAIRTVGRVAVDERRLHHVHTKYEGYVEHLYVDFTGKFVRSGRAPALHLQPRARGDAAGVPARLPRAAAAGRRAGSRRSPRAARDLLEAARQRLLLWDMRARGHRGARAHGQGRAHRRPARRAAPATWSRRCAFHGMRVTPADTLFDIADLSAVWVLADVYESDLPRSELGHGRAR